MDARYGFDGGRLEDDQHVAVAARAFEDAGKLALCGVYTAKFKANWGDLRGHVVNGLAVTLGGEPVLTGLQPFADAGAATDLGGHPTRCVRTDRDWRPDYAGAELGLEFVGQKMLVET